MQSNALGWFTAIGAFLAAAAAIYAAWETRKQVQALQTSLQIESGLKLSQEFDSPEYEEKRKAAATACAARIKYRDAGLEVENILDFFDDLAFLVRKAALDEEWVWHRFYHWIRIYMQSSEKYIATRTEKEPRVWEDLLWLYPRLNLLEKMRRPEKYKENLNDEELESFLKEEIF
jgi:hypothetical protein